MRSLPLMSDSLSLNVFFGRNFAFAPLKASILSMFTFVFSCTTLSTIVPKNALLPVTNDSDREHVKAILPDSMAGLTKMLSGLRRQEAIFVGQAAMLPSRILIRDLLPEQLPKSNDIDFDKGWQSAAMSMEQLKVVANRWRYQKR